MLEDLITSPCSTGEHDEVKLGVWIIGWGIIVRRLIDNTTGTASLSIKLLIYCSSCVEGMEWTQRMKRGLILTRMVAVTQGAQHHIDPNSGGEGNDGVTAVNSGLERQ